MVQKKKVSDTSPEFASNVETGACSTRNVRDWRTSCTRKQVKFDFFCARRTRGRLSAISTSKPSSDSFRTWLPTASAGGVDICFRGTGSEVQVCVGGTSAEMASGADVKWLMDKFKLSRDYGGVLSERYGVGRVNPFPFHRKEGLTARSSTVSRISILFFSPVPTPWAREMAGPQFLMRQLWLILETLACGRNQTTQTAQQHHNKNKQNKTICAPQSVFCRRAEGGSARVRVRVREREKERVRESKRERE